MVQLWVLQWRQKLIYIAKMLRDSPGGLIPQEWKGFIDDNFAI